MTEFLLLIITCLTAVIGYFVKAMFDEMRILQRDISDMKPKMDILWKDNIATAHSPRQLNEKGQEIFDQSGIKDIIDQNKEKLIGLVRKENISTPYDAEQSIFSVVNRLEELMPDLTPKLQDGSFKSGSNIPTILFAGGIYLRNLIFKDLGFQIEDLK